MTRFLLVIVCVTGMVGCQKGTDPDENKNKNKNDKPATSGVAGAAAKTPTAPAKRVTPTPTRKPPAPPPTKKLNAPTVSGPVGKKIQLPSGVEIQELVIGKGATVEAGMTVLAHATGTLAKNGEKFWSSHDRGQPVPFPISRPPLIEGWVYGVPGMKEGGKRKLWIPSDLAYGAAGRAPKIGPNEDLVFEIEIIKIIKK